jgi:hypothetical protein
LIEFADLAHPYQQDTDLRAYAAAGFDRVWFKATQGVNYTNPLFAEWWDLAGRLGLARGAYHYATPSVSDGADEAAHFASVLASVGGLGPRDWVAVDAEDTDGYGRPPPGARTHLVDLIVRLTDHGHTRGVVYSYADYLTGIGLTPGYLPIGWGWLHLANYGPAPDGTVQLPAGWTRDRVVARQYTDAAPTAGVPTPCDRSRVLREWLPQEDDMPAPAQWTAADWAAFNSHAGPLIAQSVADLLWAQAVAPTGDRANPVPRQPNLGKLLSSSYNHGGVTLDGVQALKLAVSALLPADHPLAARLASDVPFTPGEIVDLADPSTLTQLGDAVTARLNHLAANPAVEPTKES